MVIAIGGVSRAGKTTLADRLKTKFEQSGKTVEVLHQDQFVHPIEKIPRVRDRIDWEHPGSIDFDRLRTAICESGKSFEIVIAEGLMIFADPGINAILDKKIFIHINKAAFLDRKVRDKRWGKEPGWYVQHIWRNHWIYGRPPDTLTDTLFVNGETEIDIHSILQYLEE